MRPFELLEPRSLTEACSALARYDEARPIAGGTALLTLIKQRLLTPGTLVNLKKVGDGSMIRFDPEHGLRIGGLATIHEIETSPLVLRHCPLLAEACHVVANVRIRTMATIGGNLAHGDSQSDPPIALAALDAEIELASDLGVRSMKLKEFQRGMYETDLRPGELITAVLVPPLAPEFVGTYIKFTTGSSEERPCAGVAVLMRSKNRVCEELRVAIGAVSPIVVRVIAGEELARGRWLAPEILERIAHEAVVAVDPVDDVRGTAEYKRHLVGVLVGRAIAALAKHEENAS